LLTTEQSLELNLKKFSVGNGTSRRMMAKPWNDVVRYYFMANCDRLCLQYCLQWTNGLQSHSHSVTAAPLQTKPLMRHRTVTTSDTGLVEKQRTLHSLLWSLLITPWNKKVTTRFTVDYARYTRI